jgi:hypothetical protein
MAKSVSIFFYDRVVGHLHSFLWDRMVVFLCSFLIVRWDSGYLAVEDGVFVKMIVAVIWYS